MEKPLPPIPAKRYFTIGEVGDLCGVKPHVLRYWEQEFTQLRPMKRRGNRRYYQHHEVLMIRRIRELLYEQGFTISGARNKLQELVQAERDQRRQDGAEEPISLPAMDNRHPVHGDALSGSTVSKEVHSQSRTSTDWQAVRRELLDIRELLNTSV
jgi:DNA-binding transcriptional MerR regulator